MGVTFSFLISSPMVDLGSLVLLMSIFGAKVAVIYVVLGLVIAVAGGTLIEKLHLENQVEEFIRNAKQIDIPQEELAVKDRIKYAWEQVVETFKKVFPYILAGVGIGAFIHNWIPEDIIVRFLGTGNPFGVIIATIVGGSDVCRYLWMYSYCRSTACQRCKIGRCVVIYDGSNHTVSSIHDYAEKGNQTKTLRSVHWNLYHRRIIIVGYAFNAFQYLLI